MRIAYQGEPGAYSEAAALHFSGHADLIACEAFDDVFTAVATGRATHGILPVENSIEARGWRRSHVESSRPE